MNLKLLFASCALFLASCITGIERDISISAGEDAEISVEQAREFFEQELLTRNDDTPSPNILSPGDFTPQWNDAQISQNYRIACVDIPIIPRFGYRAIRSDLSSGDVQIKQATMSGGEALIRAFSIGTNSSYGIVVSCLNFMNQSNLDQYALNFGVGISKFSAGIGILQTIIVCTDGDITNGDILTAISAALGTDAIFISAPVTAGIVGVTGCIIGLISCFVTENMPNELYIDLGNGVKATIYILDNFMYV